MFNKVRETYDNLSNSNNAEKFYSSFYSTIVVKADMYLPNLPKPNCTLLATALAEKLYSYFKRSPKTVIVKPKEITEKEIGGIQYLAGYVIRKFLKKAKNNLNYSSMENQAIITVLTNATAEDFSNQKLIDTQNRGGLTAVTEECQQIFIRAELKFRTDTASNIHLRKIDIDKMTLDLMNNTEVIGFYKVIVDNSGIQKGLEDEILENLLEKMLKLYFRVRSFSLAKDITTKHKIALRQQKAKGGLRKNIRKQTDVEHTNR